MKIAYIGSCLSARIVKALLEQDPAHTVVAGLPHMRIDVLHDLLVGGQNRFPAQADLQAILAALDQKGLLKRNVARTASQTQEAIAEFVRRVGEADCLIVDNHYDLSAHCWKVRQGDQEFQLINLELAEPPAGFQRQELLDLGRAPGLYRAVFDHFTARNPAIKIVLVQFPTSGYEKLKGTEERIARSQRMAADLQKLGNATQVPMLHVPKRYLLPSKGPHYFTEAGYGIYATLVARLAQGEDATALLAGGGDLEALATTLGVSERSVPPAGAQRQAAPAGNPYASLPARNYWKPAVGDRFPLAIEGLYDKKFAIRAQDRVATFGSCFAQHIGHRLKARGFGYMDLEPAPQGMPESDRVRMGYGVYSARYGNIYTSLQLLQLLQRAFGELTLDEVWENDGRFYDAFRPNIFPEGFGSRRELQDERSRHLAVVRQLFEKLDVLVFTMGLTECWINRKTGAAYPTAPGVTVGRLDPDVHVFRNFRYEQIRAHMQAFFKRLKEVNPGARVLLTVSPVPLTATYEDRHVLVSTMHSKSVLRAVAGELAQEHDFVDYFPSYEVVASPPYRGMFYQNNLRTVHDEGVNHVMSHFFREHELAGEAPAGDTDAGSTEDFCDEVFLELARKTA